MKGSIRRMLQGVAVAVAAALAVTGCSSSTSSDSASGSPGTSGEALTIGVSYPTSNSPFWQNYVDFIEQGADQLGVTLNSVAADDKEDKQLADVQNLLSQGIDGLIVTPVSTAIGPQLLKLASEKGVKVVVTDRYPGYDPGANSDADYVAFIGPNDVQAGQGIAESLIDLGSKDLLGLGGTPGSSVAEGRKQGLEQGVSAKSGNLVQFEAAGDSEEAGLKAMESLLQAHPKGTVNGVWCFNDNLCLGGIKAAQNASRESELKFGGMDLTPEAIAAIEDGTYALSYGGHWLQGGFGLVMLYDALNGKAPKQTVVKLDLMKVDSKNVKQFKDQFIDNPPQYDFKELSQVTNPDATGFFEITLK